jgi:hypothetical protein
MNSLFDVESVKTAGWRNDMAGQSIVGIHSLQDEAGFILQRSSRTGHPEKSFDRSHSAKVPDKGHPVPHRHSRNNHTVIPAKKAGIQYRCLSGDSNQSVKPERHSREGGNPVQAPIAP